MNSFESLKETLSFYCVCNLFLLDWKFEKKYIFTSERIGLPTIWQDRNTLWSINFSEGECFRYETSEMT